MEIITASGVAQVNKRSPYGKWLQGWISAGGWSGWFMLWLAGAGCTASSASLLH